MHRVLQSLNKHNAVSGSVRCYPGGESLNAPRVAKLPGTWSYQAQSGVILEARA
jgi:hypothetical protein